MRVKPIVLLLVGICLMGFSPINAFADFNVTYSSPAAGTTVNVGDTFDVTATLEVTGGPFQTAIGGIELDFDNTALQVTNVVTDGAGFPPALPLAARTVAQSNNDGRAGWSYFTVVDTAVNNGTYVFGTITFEVIAAQLTGFGPGNTANNFNTIGGTPVPTSVGPVPNVTLAGGAAPPTITDITPTSGPEAGGTAFTITGTNFVPGNTTVTFGAAAVASPTVIATQITGTTPPGTGTVTVTVTVAGETPATTTFDYIPGGGDTQGPAVNNLLTNGQAGGTFVEGNNITLTATIDDTATGNSNIQILHYTTDGTDPETSGTAIPVNTPVDGAADSPTEDFSTSIAGLTVAGGPNYTITVKGRDAAGNWGPAATQGVLIVATDDQGPAITALTANGTNVLGGGTIDISDAGSAAVNVTVDDSGALGSNVQKLHYTTDGTDPISSGTATPITTAQDGAVDSPVETLIFTLDGATLGTAGSPYTITIVGFDANDNTSAASTFTLNVADDTTPPAITAATAEGQDVLGGGTVLLQEGTDLDLTVTVDDTATGGSNVNLVHYTTDGTDPETSGTATPVTIPVDGTADSATESFIAVINGLTVAGSPYTIRVKGQDAKNLWSADVQFTVTVVNDTQGPLVTALTANATDMLTTPSIQINEGDALALAATIDDSTTGNTNIAAAAYTTNGDDPTTSGIAMTAADALDSATEAFTASITGLAPATYTVRVAGRDAVGNWSAVSTFTLEVQAVNAGPSITQASLGGQTVLPLPGGIQFPRNSTISVEVTAEDTADVVEEVRYFLLGEGLGGTSPANPGPGDGVALNIQGAADSTTETFQINDIPQGQRDPLLTDGTGFFNIDFRARDASGVWGPAATVAVVIGDVDNVGPSIENIMVEGQMGPTVFIATGTSTVTLMATATDRQGGQSNILAVHYSLDGTDPNQAAGGSVIAFDPVTEGDGAFDSFEESVTKTFNVATDLNLVAVGDSTTIELATADVAGNFSDVFSITVAICDAIASIDNVTTSGRDATFTFSGTSPGGDFELDIDSDGTPEQTYAAPATDTLTYADGGVFTASLQAFGTGCNPVDTDVVVITDTTCPTDTFIGNITWQQTTGFTVEFTIPNTGGAVTNFTFDFDRDGTPDTGFDNVVENSTFVRNFGQAGAFDAYVTAVGATCSSAQTITINVQEAVGCSTPGDVNDDGNVDIADALLAAQLAAGLNPAQASCPTQADVITSGTGQGPADGNTTSGDALAIAQQAAGCLDMNFTIPAGDPCSLN